MEQSSEQEAAAVDGFLKAYSNRRRRRVYWYFDRAGCWLKIGLAFGLGGGLWVYIVAFH